MAAERDVPVILKLYDLMLWSMDHTARFPRHHRYSLGNTPVQRPVGLPIGNLTSQWFANLYLTPLDLFLTASFRAPGYVRYGDDFRVFADDRATLMETMARCGEFLATRHTVSRPI